MEGRAEQSRAEQKLWREQMTMADGDAGYTRLEYNCLLVRERQRKGLPRRYKCLVGLRLQHGVPDHPLSDYMYKHTLQWPCGSEGRFGARLVAVNCQSRRVWHPQKADQVDAARQRACPSRSGQGRGLGEIHGEIEWRIMAETVMGCTVRGFGTRVKLPYSTLVEIHFGHAGGGGWSGALPYRSLLVFSKLMPTQYSWMEDTKVQYFGTVAKVPHLP